MSHVYNSSTLEQRQEDHCKFEASLICMWVLDQPAIATPCLKKEQYRNVQSSSEKRPVDQNSDSGLSLGFGVTLEMPLLLCALVFFIYKPAIAIELVLQFWVLVIKEYSFMI